MGVQPNRSQDVFWGRIMAQQPLHRRSQIQTRNEEIQSHFFQRQIIEVDPEKIPYGTSGLPAAFSTSPKASRPA